MAGKADGVPKPDKTERVPVLEFDTAAMLQRKCVNNRRLSLAHEYLIAILLPVISDCLMVCASAQTSCQVTRAL